MAILWTCNILNLFAHSFESIINSNRDWTVWWFSYCGSFWHDPLSWAALWLSPTRKCFDSSYCGQICEILMLLSSFREFIHVPSTNLYANHQKVISLTLVLIFFKYLFWKFPFCWLTTRQTWTLLFSAEIKWTSIIVVVTCKCKNLFHGKFTLHKYRFN